MCCARVWRKLTCRGATLCWRGSRSCMKGMSWLWTALVNWREKVRAEPGSVDRRQKARLLPAAPSECASGAHARALVGGLTGPDALDVAEHEPAHRRHGVGGRREDRGVAPEQAPVLATENLPEVF